MKGMVEEIFWFVIIVLTVFMLFAFFTYQQGTRGIEVKKSVEERILDEEGNTAVFSLFNNKLPFVEKVYLECIIDSILQGSFYKKEMDKVFYGNGVGNLNTSEIIPPLLDKYVEGRWKLEISTPDGSYVYGKADMGDIIYSYESLIPVPEERIGKVTFQIG